MSVGVRAAIGCVPLADVIPRARCFASDFKCAGSAGEAALFEDLATFLGMDARVVQCEVSRSGAVRLSIRFGGRVESLMFRRSKYYVPPTAMIQLLNYELARFGRTDRLVICQDDFGEAVVLATTIEATRLAAGGLVL